MLKFGRKALLFFLTGETNLRDLRLAYLPVVLLLLPTMAVVALGWNPPVLIRLAFTTAVAAFVGKRMAANGGPASNLRVGLIVTFLPFALLPYSLIAHSWSSYASPLWHGSVYLFSRRHASRGNDLYLHDEFPGEESPQGD